MAWFSYNRLYPVFEWLWRRLGFIWRCATAVLRPIVGYAFLAIDWRKNPGRRQDGCEDCEGQYGAAAGVSAERAAGRDREPASELSRYEEEDEAGEFNKEKCHVGSGREEGDEFNKEKCHVESGREEGDEFNKEKCHVESGREEDDDDEFDSMKYRVETTDEFYCGYDSTWETEENTPKRARRSPASRHYKFNRFENAARDMQNYRHNYPNRPQRWMKPVSDEKPNLNFYLGQKPSVPDGVYIHNFHNEWARHYDALERVHTYIQWLFPLQEPGMNYDASPLTKEEIKCFVENSTAKENLLKSYKLMLDFYGIKLCNEETGEVKRALNWDDRFNNLNTHTHNNLRITRILKCLGTLGYPHYQAPLVRFFLEETLVRGELPNVKDSVLNYFVFAVLDMRQRRHLIKFAYFNYDRKDEFVWCPKKFQMMWSGLSRAPFEKGDDWSF